MRGYAEAVRILSAEDNDENQSLVQSFEEEIQSNPAAYQPWEKPAAWTSELDIQQCHQAGMHLLFLGVVKTMVFLVSDWAIRRKKYSTLRESIKLRSTALEGLKLSWLKVQTYQGDKLGGGGFWKTIWLFVGCCLGFTVALTNFPMMTSMNHQHGQTTNGAGQSAKIGFVQGTCQPKVMSRS